MLNEFFSTSWETRDQSHFRFSSITRVNNAVTEDVRGEVERSDGTVPSDVKFRKPEKKRVALDAKVLFPTQYTIEAIKAAKLGHKIFAADLFDGSPDHIPYEAITVMGPPSESPAQEEARELPDLLVSKVYWPTQIGYHSKEKSDGIPEFEISMRMYENGVGTHLILDYGDFVLKGELMGLKELPGGC